MHKLHDRNAWVGAALFLLSLAVYAATTSPSVAFWDCGEFTATAYRLGIPHQPGTPLYVLVGRVFSMLPLGVSVARKINLLSGFFSALAVVFLYLTAVRLQQAWAEERRQPSPPWLIRLGAAIGAGFLAFSTTFWDNAIEAEVYALAAFTMAVTSYLSVRWYALRENVASHTVMLLIVYFMGLSIGFHLGSFLVFPGVLVLALSARERVLPSIDLLAVAAAMFAFVASTMGSHPLLVGTAWSLAIAAVVVAIWRVVQRRTFALAGIGLFALGISTHLFMLIRAHHDPMINETDPTHLNTLLSVLRREQYPPRKMWVREAPLLWQLGHFWGSVVWTGGQMAGAKVIGYLQQFTFMPSPSRPANFLDTFVPLGLWLYGLVCQARGHKRLFAAFFTTLLINSLGLVLLLNFTGEEVRDRDYFYFGAYQFLALFIGLGAGGLLRLAWLSWRDRRWGVPATAAGGSLLLAMALLPVLMARTGHVKWFEHDRSHDVIARNYGYNMLAGLEPNAILFTNGDNDTFPLWYLQEVEGIRRDVRVVNLSLINLPWYILQLRDYPPKVPITWSDEQIEGRAPITHYDFQRTGGIVTQLVAQRLPDDSVLWVRDMAVWHILRTNLAGPLQPVYFAVTIPDDAIQDFVPYLTMEGLVYRFDHNRRSEDGRQRVDAAAVLHNLQEVYDWTGVLDAAGQADRSIYRDANTRHLLRNYPAALCRAAYADVTAEDYQRAATALEFAYRLEPDFPVVVDMLPLIYLQLHRVDDVMRVGAGYLATLDDPRQMAFDVTDGMLAIGERDRALQWAELVRTRLPNDPLVLQLLYRVHHARGELDQAEQMLTELVRLTNSPEAAAELQRLRESRAAGGGADSAAPPASAPGAPAGEPQAPVAGPGGQP